MPEILIDHSRFPDMQPNLKIETEAQLIEGKRCMRRLSKSGMKGGTEGVFSRKCSPPATASMSPWSVGMVNKSLLTKLSSQRAGVTLLKIRLFWNDLWWQN